MTQFDLLEPPEIALVRGNPQSFPRDFLRWLLDNWRIWREFERCANEIWDSGTKRFGARCIWEHLRYETALRERDGDYKLNDHQPPNLARLYMLKHAERAGFFETRVQEHSTKRAA